MTNAARLSAALKHALIIHRNELQINASADLMALAEHLARDLDAIGVTMPPAVPKVVGRRAPVEDKRQIAAN
jgi:hypothetical protein